MMQEARADDGSLSFGLLMYKPMGRILTVDKKKKNFYQKKRKKRHLKNNVTVYLLNRLGWRDSNGSKGALSSLLNKCNTYFVSSYEILFFFFFQSGAKGGDK